MLPARRKKNSHRADERRRFPGHRAWVRGHHCCACGTGAGIQCAHVRDGTDGGTGMKPSDWWTISLCADCHRQQHEIGEKAFEAIWGINMKALAAEFARKSPHAIKMASAMEITDD